MRGDEHLPPEDGSERLSVTPTDDGMSVSGDVDVSTWSSFRDALHRTVAGGDRRDVLLDLEGLTFIDAHGIELIAEAARALPRKGRLILRHSPHALRRAAQIIHLDREPGIVIEEGTDDEL